MIVPFYVNVQGGSSTALTPTDAKKIQTQEGAPSTSTTVASAAATEDLSALQSKLDPDEFYIYRYKTAYCP
jgi:hypothetical protein